jgi:cation:H+ antiporter
MGILAAWFLAGVVLLVGGAEALVRGASGLARSLGIPPLLVGLTVVAYGTSAPELAVSVRSALAGQGDIAVGNVVGSNVMNVLLVLGGSALVAPLVLSRGLVRIDAPVLAALSALVWAMARDGRIDRAEGILLVALSVAYSVWALRRAGVTPGDSGAASGGRFRQRVVDAGLALVGFGMLLLGARWVVMAAVGFAQSMGVSELVIGLTIVAVGTSLPEAATSLMAAARGQRDIAVGNVVGSNVFNLTAVLGAAAAAAPGGVAVANEALRIDIPVMVAVAAACVPLFAVRYRLSRWEGALFLAYYAAYALYLVLASGHHPALDLYGRAMIILVFPVSAALLAVATWRAMRPRVDASA